MNKRKRQTTPNTGVADMGTDYDQVYLARWAHEIIKQHEGIVVKQAEDPPTPEEIVSQVATALVQQVLESVLAGKRPYDEAFLQSEEGHPQAPYDHIRSSESHTDSNAEDTASETADTPTGSDSGPGSGSDGDDGVAKRLKMAES